MQALAPQIAKNFRDQFRAGRADALADTEGFSEILFPLERLGCFLTGKGLGLGQFREKLVCYSKHSPLATEIPNQHREFHTPFGTLFELVREARNDALHQGAVARHLTMNATILAIVLEDALSTDLELVSDFMIPSPVCAELWQPISFIRQQMLLHSFSFLPFKQGDGKWHLVSDAQIASFILSFDRKSPERKSRLAMPLSDALTNGLKTDEAETLPPETPVSELANRIKNRPMLVCDSDVPHRLLGILTAFDLM